MAQARRHHIKQNSGIESFDRCFQGIEDAQSVIGIMRDCTVNTHVDTHLDIKVGHFVTLLVLLETRLEDAKKGLFAMHEASKAPRIPPLSVVK